MNETTLFPGLNIFYFINIAGVVLLAIVFIFALLIFRQTLQMTQVLPTPLSPAVRILVIFYVAAVFIATLLALGIVVSH